MKRIQVGQLLAVRSTITLSCPRPFRTFKQCNLGHTIKLPWDSVNEFYTKTYNVVGVITGHLPLKSNLRKIGKVNSPEWRVCAEDDVTAETANLPRVLMLQHKRHWPAGVENKPFFYQIH